MGYFISKREVNLIESVCVVGKVVEMGDIIYRSFWDGFMVWEIGVFDCIVIGFFVLDLNFKYVNKFYFNSS